MDDQIRILHELCGLEKHDEILDRLSEMGKSVEVSPYLLVLKGDCILLGSNEAYSLEDAEAAYKQAIEIDPDYIEAYSELGYFYLNVLNSLEKAQPYFEKALALSNQQLTVAMSAYARFLQESVGTDRAIEYLETGEGVALDKTVIKEKIEEIREDDYLDPRWMKEN